MGAYGSPETHPKLTSNQYYNNDNINQNSNFEPIKCPHCSGTIYIPSQEAKTSNSKSIGPLKVFKYTLSVCAGLIIAFFLFLFIFSMFTY